MWIEKVSAGTWNDFFFKSGEEEWQKVFSIGAALFIGSNLIFVLFGSGHIQKWNTINNDDPLDGNLNETEMKIITASEELDLERRLISQKSWFEVKVF